MLYVGRRYYRDVLWGTVCFRRVEGVPNYAVWACRVAVACFAVMIVMFTRLGLDWTLAVPGLLLMLLTVIGVSRITAETGMFFCQPRWQALGVFLGLMGAAALGPQVIVILGLLCLVLFMDPSQNLMAYLLTGLKICDSASIRPGRIGLASGVGYLMALAVALPVTLWAAYNFGPNTDLSRFRLERIPTMSFIALEKAVTELKVTGRLELSEQLGPFERFKYVNPTKTFMWAAGIGFFGLLAIAVARLRFSWWPIHPVIMMVWFTAPTISLSASFLIGWFVKSAVTWIGGAKSYRNVKPMMVGIIAGDVIAAIGFVLFGAIYRIVTGNQPKPYYFF